MSLTKAAFALLAVAFFMPTPPDSDLEHSARIDSATDSRQLFSVATDTVGDLSAFCGRQPAVCDTAHHLLRKFEAKAKYSVRLLYEWASDQTADGPLPYPYRDQAVADPLETGSSPALLAGSESYPPASTLTLEDLIPEWRGPSTVKRS